MLISRAAIDSGLIMIPHSDRKPKTPKLMLSTESIAKVILAKFGMKIIQIMPMQIRATKAVM